MTNFRIAALTTVVGLASALLAQPATEFRFANGTNAITVEPGAAVPVEVWAVGLPNIGTWLPWTTPPGTGQPGMYSGFVSVLTNITATGGNWTPPTSASIPSPFIGPPFGHPGVVSGTNVMGVNITVGFNPPVTASSFLLWTGTITVGTSNVSLATVIQPAGSNLGFEGQLNVGLGLNVSQFLQAANGSAQITVPGPGGMALLGLAALVCARRRRERMQP